MSKANSVLYWSAYATLHAAGYTIGSREQAYKLSLSCTDEKVRKQLRIVVDLWDERNDD